LKFTKKRQKQNLLLLQVVVQAIDFENANDLGDEVAVVVVGAILVRKEEGRKNHPKARLHGTVTKNRLRKKTDTPETPAKKVEKEPKKEPTIKKEDSRDSKDSDRSRRGGRGRGRGGRGRGGGIKRYGSRGGYFGSSSFNGRVNAFDGFYDPRHQAPIIIQAPDDRFYQSYRREEEKRYGRDDRYDSRYSSRDDDSNRRKSGGVEYLPPPASYSTPVVYASSSSYYPRY